MTLVLGARCRDGVAMIADRKIVALGTGQFLRYEMKIYAPIRNVIFGYDGSTDMFDVFHKYVVGDLVILRDDPVSKYKPDNLFEKFCNTINILNRIRANQYFTLDIMVGRIFAGNIRSDLHVINCRGDCKVITGWNPIGHGGSKAKPLVEKKWNANITMKDFAKLSYCVIKYIEIEGLDDSVGTGNDEPTVKYLADDAEIDREAPHDDLNEFKNVYSEYADKFRSLKHI